MELELAMQRVGFSAQMTQHHIVNTTKRLHHLDQCAKVLLAKALRFAKE